MKTQNKNWSFDFAKSLGLDIFAGERTGFIEEISGYKNQILITFRIHDATLLIRKRHAFYSEFKESDDLPATSPEVEETFHSFLG